MRLTVFGASGRTGQHVLERALSAGYEVTVLVRDPSRVKLEHAGLKVQVGSLQDAAQVEEAISGSEAVISVLGPTANKPTFEISSATETIIAAMKKLGVRRLILSLGAGVSDLNDAPGLFNRFMDILVKVFSRHVYDDMLQVAAEVRAADLDWTIVRVPMLTDGPRTGKLRVGYVGKGIGPRISRADMADFMVHQVADQTHLRKAPAISNSP